MECSRISLAKNLIDDGRHVIICAPSGYGKSILLENIAKLLSESITECNKKKFFPDSNQKVLLLDNGHELDDDLIIKLLSQNTLKQRVFIVLYHVKYMDMPILIQKRGVRIVNSHDLKLTKQELYDAGLKDIDIGELIKETDGWPFACANYHEGTLSISDYLDALINQIGDDKNDFLDKISKLGGLTGPIYIEECLLKRILNQGFPIFMYHESWHVSPLIIKHISQKNNQETERFNEINQLNIIKSIFASNLHISQKIETVEYFFEKYGCDDLHREIKIDLLVSLKIDNLSPFLIDILAHYYLSFGENFKAETVLMFQMSKNNCTTQTYVHLARIAGKRNDFIAQSEYVRKGRDKAVTELDLCKSDLAFADYYSRVNKFEEALESSKSAYNYANKIDNVEMRLLALKSIAYTNQMLGNISTAITAGEEALSLCRDFDKYNFHFSSIAYNLADISKDLGDYDSALNYLSESLNKGETACGTSLPYIYNCLGLVYLELGDNQNAIKNFDLSLNFFEKHGNTSGSILPATYLGFVYYRMKNLNGVEFCFQKVKEIGNLIRDNDSSASEYYAFYPLVESARLVLKGYFEEALEALGRLLTKDTLTYDSVLLSTLLKGYILNLKGAISKSYVHELVSILDARNTVNDPTALAYSFDFRCVYYACFDKSGDKRFQELANIKIKSKKSDNVKYRIYLHTIGNVFLEINGKRIRTRSLAPLYVLAYFIYKKDWIKIEDLGLALFSGRSSSKNSASQALSGLRAIFRSFTSDLEEVLSIKGDPRGLCLMESENFSIKMDLNHYLSDFNCENTDVDLLFQMLKNITTFLPKNEGVFSNQVNQDLQIRASQVALHLYDFFTNNSKEEYAAESILYGIRFVDDDKLIEIARSIKKSMPVKQSIDEELRKLDIYMI